MQDPLAFVSILSIKGLQAEKWAQTEISGLLAHPREKGLIRRSIFCGLSTPQLDTFKTNPDVPGRVMDMAQEGVSKVRLWGDSQRGGF